MRRSFPGDSGDPLRLVLASPVACAGKWPPMKHSARLKTGLVAIATCLLFTACSAGPSPAPAGSAAPDSQASGSAATAGNTPGTPSPTASGAPGDALDNGGHAEYTWDDYVAAKRKMSGLASWPEVERIRFISQEEVPPVQARCLTEAGFPATLGTDGTSYEVKTVEGQDEAFALASYVCSLQYPTDLRYAQALTRTQLRILYAHYRDQLAPCLQEHGLEVSAVPSEETFVEGIASGTNEWNPYLGLETDPRLDESLNKECPPMPPSELLYGS